MLLLTVGCSGGGSGSGEAQEQVYVVEGADTSVLCPDVTILTENFVLTAEGPLDNKLAAQRAPNPPGREQEYENWGRVTGYFAQWTFSSPSALTAEELSQLSEEEAAAARERARQEALANPFMAANCSVDLFENAEGAHQAFLVQAIEARNPPVDPASGFTLGVSERPDPKIGGESIDIVYLYPTFSMFVITFRERNVIGSVSVIASVTDDTADYAGVLATAFMERIDDGLQVAG